LSQSIDLKFSYPPIFPSSSIPHGILLKFILYSWRHLLQFPYKEQYFVLFSSLLCYRWNMHLREWSIYNVFQSCEQHQVWMLIHSEAHMILHYCCLIFV
jgi:hypothetical protein